MSAAGNRAVSAEERSKSASSHAPKHKDEKAAAAEHHAAEVSSMSQVEGLLPKPEITDPSLYLSRELSWLAFNRRVLSEAMSTDWPLLERVKFFAIFFSNLDEFFMIRVSALHTQHAALSIQKSADGLTPGETLSSIKTEVRTQIGEAAKLLSDDLLPARQAAGIRFIGGDAQR